MSMSQPTSQDSPGIQKVKYKEMLTLTKLVDPLDRTNWNLWHVDMHHVLKVCRVLGYVKGKIPKPSDDDPELLATWEHNDSYAQILISNNITHDQKIHLDEGTSEEMWKSLESIHEVKGAQTAINLLQNFHGIHANDDMDIVEHLKKLKSYHVCINQACSKSFKVSEVEFKATIASSLPLSWDTYTEPYVGEYDKTQPDYRKQMSSKAFIGDIIEWYKNLQDHSVTNRTNQVLISQTSLNWWFSDRIAPANKGSDFRCPICNGQNHYAKDC